jgi:hypothetical protein
VAEVQGEVAWGCGIKANTKCETAC